MKTYLFSLRAESKDSSDILSKSIEVNTGYLTKDIIKNLFLEYLNIEVYSVDYIPLISKFFAKSLDYDVYIDYEEL